MSRHLILPLLLVLAGSAEVFDIMTDIQDLRVPDSTACIQEHQRLAECVQPHATLINYVMSTFKETDVYNIGFMRKALQISKNVSECLGHEIQCPVPKFVVFSLDTAIYAGERLYGDAFHCFINAQGLEITENCVKSVSRGPSSIFWLDTSKFQTSKNELTECVAKKLYGVPSCSIGRIVSLYQAGTAGIDWMFEASQFDAGKPTGPIFNGDKYCDN
ncbi:hypothetical protein CRE_11401 [Caenorhabditis remanei]|uniref:Uncharacterized protein n=1 Tax=Caenorhabditis remanei TaxID=31234 RepID=E3N740_CAERE|nr:hypothetical protein CRE_11401 [Caenorhabditis remanei]